MTKRNLVIYISIMSSLLLILLYFLQWTLVEYITPFLIPLVFSLFWGLFTLSFLYSIIEFFRNTNRTRRKAKVSLIVMLLTLIFVVTVPFTKIIIRVDFWMNYLKRHEVVNWLQSTQIQNKATFETQFLELPIELSRVSRSGEIIFSIDNGDLKVFFFTYRGILDNYSGFVYDSSASNKLQEFLGDNVREEIKMADNWFWVSLY